MIIKKKSEGINEEQQKFKNEKKFNFKMNKKKIIALIIGVIILISLLLFFLLNKKEKVVYSIEIPTKNINYIYAPNNQIIGKLKKGDSFDLIILPEVNKGISCYTNNSDIIQISGYTISAVGTGKTEIYCRYKGINTNVIDIKVGD